jgi:hypothetical protein
MYDSAQHFIANNPDTFSSVPTWVTTFVCGSAGSSLLPILFPSFRLLAHHTLPIAGVSSWGAIYPIDLVKAKLQRNALADAPYERPWSIFRRLSAGGIPKLYRGLGISAFRCVWDCLSVRRGALFADCFPSSRSSNAQVHWNPWAYVYVLSLQCLSPLPLTFSSPQGPSSKRPALQSSLEQNRTEPKTSYKHRAVSILLFPLQLSTKVSPSSTEAAISLSKYRIPFLVLRCLYNNRINIYTPFLSPSFLSSSFPSPPFPRLSHLASLTRTRAMYRFFLLLVSFHLRRQRRVGESTCAGDGTAAETPRTAVERDGLSGGDGDERVVKGKGEGAVRSEEKHGQHRLVGDGKRLGYLRLTAQSAKAPPGRDRVCASATKPSGESTSGGGWEGEVQRKS